MTGAARRGSGPTTERRSKAHYPASLGSQSKDVLQNTYAGHVAAATDTGYISVLRFVDLLKTALIILTPLRQCRDFTTATGGCRMFHQLRPPAVMAIGLQQKGAGRKG